MVALQILVLSAQVRILVPQPKKPLRNPEGHFLYEVRFLEVAGAFGDALELAAAADVFVFHEEVFHPVGVELAENDFMVDHAGIAQRLATFGSLWKVKRMPASFTMRPVSFISSATSWTSSTLRTAGTAAWTR